MHKKCVSVAGYGLNLEISAPYSCRCAWKVGACVFMFGRQQFRGYSEVFMLTCLFCDARSSRPGKGAAGSDQLALGGLAPLMGSRLAALPSRTKSPESAHLVPGFLPAPALSTPRGIYTAASSPAADSWSHLHICLITLISGGARLNI